MAGIWDTVSQKAIIIFTLKWPSKDWLE